MDPDVHALTESELYVLQEEKNMFQFHIYNTNQKYSATDENWSSGRTDRWNNGPNSSRISLV